MSELVNRIEKSLAYRLGNRYKKFMATIGMRNFRYQLYNVRLQKDPEKKLLLAEKLNIDFPEHPAPAYEVADALFLMRNPEAFEAIKQYYEVRTSWIHNMGLENIGFDFLSHVLIVGSFGNFHTLNSLTLAAKLGLVEDFNPTMLVPSGTKIRNLAFLKYFRNHINIIEDDAICESLAPVSEMLLHPLTWCVPITADCLSLPAFHNYVEKKRGYNKDFYFTLSDEHRKIGLKQSALMGLPSNAWYVVLHIREPGYRGEIQGPEDFRNADPLSFMDAIRTITDAGGWVVRVGDPTMTPLPPLSNVIDYACSDFRSDVMDVYLGATARFCIGSSSGYFAVPTAFGVPVLLTNALETVNGYQLTKRDLFLPKLCRRKDNGAVIGMGELMQFPNNTLTSSQSYKDKGIEWFDNDPDDIVMATHEMLERTDGGFSEKKVVLTKNQQTYLNIATEASKTYKTNLLEVTAPLPDSFLSNYPDLLA